MEPHGPRLEPVIAPVMRAELLGNQLFPSIASCGSAGYASLSFSAGACGTNYRYSGYTQAEDVKRYRFTPLKRATSNVPRLIRALLRKICAWLHEI